MKIAVTPPAAESLAIAKLRKTHRSVQYQDGQGWYGDFPVDIKHLVNAYMNAVDFDKMMALVPVPRDWESVASTRIMPHVNYVCRITTVTRNGNVA